METITRVHASLLLIPAPSPVVLAPAASTEEEEGEEEEEEQEDQTSNGLLVLHSLAYLSESAPPQLVRELLSLYLHLR